MKTDSSMIEIIPHSVIYQPGLIIVKFPFSFVTQLKVGENSDLILSEVSDNKENQFFLHSLGIFFTNQVSVNGKFNELVFSYYKPYLKQIESSNSFKKASYIDKSTFVPENSHQECTSLTDSHTAYDSITTHPPNSNTNSESSLEHNNEHVVFESAHEILLKRAHSRINSPEKKRQQPSVSELVEETYSDTQLVFSHNLNILVYGYQLSSDEQAFREKIRRYLLDKKYKLMEKTILEWYLRDRSEQILKISNETICSPDKILKQLKDPKDEQASNCCTVLLSLYTLIFLENNELEFVEKLRQYLDDREYKKVICSAMEGVKGTAFKVKIRTEGKLNLQSNNESIKINVLGSYT